MASASGNSGRREALARLAGLAGLSAATGGLGYWLYERGRHPERRPAAARRSAVTIPADAHYPELAVTRGDDPRWLVRAAVEQLGGMARFVARGNVVLLKPNASWDRSPEQAANTNPDVVAEVARLCRDAGASEVLVADVSINEPRRSFARSGIAAAARAAGARVVLPDESLFRDADLRGTLLDVWPVFDPFLTVDRVINIPVAKHHSLTGVTLGMKNWYGILGGERQRLHQRIDQSVVDLAAFMRPVLTVVDGWRVLLRNGPGGGNLTDVLAARTIIAGTDPVAVDAYAARAWWNLDATALPYLRLAASRGLGSADLSSVRTSVVTV